VCIRNALLVLLILPIMCIHGRTNIPSYPCAWYRMLIIIYKKILFIPSYFPLTLTLQRMRSLGHIHPSTATRCPVTRRKARSTTNALPTSRACPSSTTSGVC